MQPRASSRREAGPQSRFTQARAMEVIGQLAGGMAHDFNNCLTVILGEAGILLNDPLPASQRRRVEAIHRASERAAALTRRLLALGRRKMIERRVFDLNPLIVEVTKLLRRLIREDIEFVTRLSPKPVTIEADPGEIEQVIINLAVNARDAMPDGGTLTIETVVTETGARGESVVLTIADTGSGMTEEVKAHLFEPFFTTKEQGKGTGLGLATVHGIVRESGGEIACESELGRGTTFTISLPRARAEVTPVTDRWVYGDLPGGTETVLVVEDSSDVRELVREILTAQGYAVLDAADADGALRISKDHQRPIHLLLTDVVMPGMGGRGLAEALCARRPDMKVLYVSGHADDVIVASGVLRPDLALLRKPFTPLELARNVRGALDALAAPRETLGGATSSSRDG